jgi:hypothetical protein
MHVEVSYESAQTFEASRFVIPGLLVLLSLGLGYFLVFRPILHHLRMKKFYEESGDLADRILGQSQLLERCLTEPWMTPALRERFEELTKETAPIAGKQLVNPSYETLVELRKIWGKWFQLGRDFLSASSMQPEK